MRQLLMMLHLVIYISYQAKTFVFRYTFFISIYDATYSIELFLKLTFFHQQVATNRGRLIIRGGV